MTFDKFEYSNKGGRSYNEDSTGSKVIGSRGLFVVADGLGGHAFGELASKCAVETLLEGFGADLEITQDFLADRIAEANRRILKLQQEKGEIMKSTVVSLLINDETAYWAHVGDSRLYYFRDGELCYCTEDHSVAYKKYKAGEIGRDDISKDEDQSQLLRSLGGRDRNEPVVSLYPAPLLDGDAFLLCSDGVWEYLRDEEVLIDLLKSENAEQWAEHLLMRMMDRIEGENDNLSLITLIVH